MTTHDPIDPRLLDRYLVGDCTPDEAASVERWLAARPGNAALLEALKAEFGVGDADPEPSDARAVWAGIARRVTWNLPRRERRAELWPEARSLGDVFRWEEEPARRPLPEPLRT